ncbi:hypothetical protein HMPREF9374_2347 [Desmospora sp. 8437]|nr:hypothetical protein HMPREF9374_2347 [Desmospora sp. 8437]
MMIPLGRFMDELCYSSFTSDSVRPLKAVQSVTQYTADVPVLQ